MSDHTCRVIETVGLSAYGHDNAIRATVAQALARADVTGVN